MEDQDQNPGQQITPQPAPLHMPGQIIQPTPAPVTAAAPPQPAAIIVPTAADALATSPIEQPVEPLPTIELTDQPVVIGLVGQPAVSNNVQPTVFTPTVSAQSGPVILRPAIASSPDGATTLSPAAPSIVSSPQITVMKRKSKLPLIIGIAIVILLVVGGIGHAVLTSHNAHKTITFTESESGSGESSDGTAKVTDTVNCGSKDCFDQDFASCTPATMTSSSDVGNVTYQIYGKQGTGCSVLFEYTANPYNPAWVDQPMTCDLDNTQNLAVAIGDVTTDLVNQKNSYSCTGPLVSILQNLTTQ
jgi:hypothetical protein